MKNRKNYSKEVFNLIHTGTLSPIIPIILKKPTILIKWIMDIPNRLRKLIMGIPSKLISTMVTLNLLINHQKLTILHRLL